MNTSTISTLVLWLIVCIISYMVINIYLMMEKSATKQRTLPGRQNGLPLKAPFPQKSVKTIDGIEIALSGEKKGTILLFSAPSCSVCQTLYPLLNQIQKSKQNYKFIIIMHSSKEEAIDAIKKHNISVPVTLIDNNYSTEILSGGFPFAYLLSQSGSVINKGVVNTIGDFDLLVRSRIAA